MGRERRTAARKRKRMKVRYGDSGLDCMGFSTDISIGGIYLTCTRLAAPGTRLHLHLTAREFDFYAEGVVARVFKVPLNLRRVKQQGMGIRFLNPAEIVGELVPSEERHREALGIELESRAAVDKLLTQQLEHGAVLVPVSPDAVQTQAIVEFSLQLTFVEDAELLGRGRVVQLVERGNTKLALVEVDGAAELREKLRSLAKVGQSDS